LTRFIKRFGIIKAAKIGGFLCGPIFALIPVCTYVAQYSMYALWPILIIWITIKNMLGQIIFCAVNLMVNNSVDIVDLGTVNGISMSLGSLARSVGPALGGVLWSVSSTMRFPGYQFVVFVFVGLIGIVIGFFAGFVPKHLDRTIRHEPPPGE